MKKMKKPIVIIVITSFVLIIIYCVIPIKGYKCPPPERPFNVLIDAQWCGDCDGGEWIYLVPDEEQYHFIVYMDWGQVQMDAIFIPDRTTTLSRENWKDQIFSYVSGDSQPYILGYEEPGVFYILMCQYPAFGGTEWEIIKEKEIESLSQ